MKFTLLRDAQVTFLTFGNCQVFTMEAGKEFHYDEIKERNESYTVFQNGLNLYVFPTNAIEPE